jgi:nucleoid DNA-binding protein
MNKKELVEEITEITNCDAEQVKRVSDAVAGFLDALRVRFIQEAGAKLERTLARSIDD